MQTEIYRDFAVNTQVQRNRPLGTYKKETDEPFTTPEARPSKDQRHWEQTEALCFSKLKTYLCAAY
jgi:hypothetical protein